MRVQLNQTTDLPVQMHVGLQGETVEVSAAGAELVNTTDTTLAKSFGERQVVELGITNVGGAFGGGVNNLALLAPNVSSAAASASAPAARSAASGRATTTSCSTAWTTTART